MKIFTTGQVAKICNVSPHQVSKWCDGGSLCSYRIPGSFDRRITDEQLSKFVREKGIPVEGFEVFPVYVTDPTPRP